MFALVRKEGFREDKGLAQGHIMSGLQFGWNLTFDSDLSPVPRGSSVGYMAAFLPDPLPQLSVCSPLHSTGEMPEGVAQE